MIRLFESAPNRCVKIIHIKDTSYRAHADTLDNERADALIKQVIKLRFDLMQLQSPDQLIDSIRRQLSMILTKQKR